MFAMLVRRTRGDHDDRQTLHGRVRAHVTGEIKTVHARHFNVGDHNIRTLLLKFFQCIDAILGNHYRVAFARQQAVSDFATVSESSTTSTIRGAAAPPVAVIASVLPLEIAIRDFSSARKAN